MIVFIKQASTVLAIVTEKSFYDFKSKLFDFLLKRVSGFHELNYLFKLSFIYVNDYFLEKKKPNYLLQYILWVLPIGEFVYICYRQNVVKNIISVNIFFTVWLITVVINF